MSRYLQVKNPIEQILIEIDNLKRGIHSHLNIGVGFYPPLLSLFPTISELYKEEIYLTLNIIERDWRNISGAILSEEIDFGVIDISIAEKSDKYFFKRLPRHPCSIATRHNHPLGKLDVVKIEDLYQYPYCGPHPSRWAIDYDEFAKSLFGQTKKDNGQITKLTQVHTFNSASNIVLSTNAFGVFPRILFYDYRKNSQRIWIKNNFNIYDIDGLSWLSTNYGIVWKRERKLSAIDLKFIDKLENIDNKISLIEQKKFG